MCIQNRFSVSYSQCVGEHFEPKFIFRLHTKKLFHDGLCLEISGIENVYPIV